MQSRKLSTEKRYHKTFGFDVKETTDAGRVRGHGSVFGVVDSYNEVVAPGAFEKSLADWKRRGAMPAMLRGHNSNIVPGVWLEMREDLIGRDCLGECILETREGLDCYHLLKRKAIRGLSIGYNPEVWEVDKDTGIVTLKQVDLWEVSVVTFPANVEAMIEDVKESIRGKLFDGNIPTEREFEDFLRDVGFSRTQAKKVVAGGYRTLRDAEADEAIEIEQALLELSHRLNPNAGDCNNGTRNQRGDRKDRDSI